jgi:ribosomal protein S12 methylthiotransferase
VTLVRVAKWRALCPGLTIRSTFIVGFPGETEEEFSELLAFLEEARLDRVGCFRYEAVQGAAANKIAPHVPEETKVERYARCMEAQQKISAKRMKRAVGTRQAVIIDQAEIGTAVGRSRGDAPAIDGVVHVRASRPLKVGEIATIKIERADECDLYGTAVGF